MKCQTSVAALDGAALMLRGTYNPVVEGLSPVQYLLMGMRLEV